WCIEQGAREVDVQHLLGHSSSTMLRRYTATYNAEKAAQAHEQFSPGDRYALTSASGDGRPFIAMVREPKRNLLRRDTSIPERGVFVLLNIDSTDAEIETAARALGWRSR